MESLFLITATLFTSNNPGAAEREGESTSPKEKWNRRYEHQEYVCGTEPTAFLKQKIDMVKKGRALVLAMGEGRNAVYLAQHGFDVTGVDISEVAIEKCKRLAAERGTKVNTVAAALTDYDMGKNQYDLITDFYFYDKSIFPKVIDALKPGGIFILEQFSIDHLKYGKFGPRNPDYLVKPNELLDRFKSTRILYYEDIIVERDEGMHKGTAAIIRLIARKPADHN